MTKKDLKSQQDSTCRWAEQNALFYGIAVRMMDLGLESKLDSENNVLTAVSKVSQTEYEVKIQPKRL